eukprot:m.12845 g.12845  ORF g.12845 m.12845 type:complete len:92 (+) comp4367_c0_seq2:1703-1978(+)
MSTFFTLPRDPPPAGLSSRLLLPKNLLKPPDFFPLPCLKSFADMLAGVLGTRQLVGARYERHSERTQRSSKKALATTADLTQRSEDLLLLK